MIDPASLGTNARRTTHSLIDAEQACRQHPCRMAAHPLKVCLLYIDTLDGWAAVICQMFAGVHGLMYY